MTEKIAAALAILLLIACGFWARIAAPCGLFKFADAGQVPARCLMKEGK